MEENTGISIPKKIIGGRAGELYHEHCLEIWRHTDRLFAGLLIFEWVACLAAAFFISPRTWAGQYSQVHIHIFAAIFLGALITLPSALLGFMRPGATSTRYIIGVCQMLISGLLIDLTGGRIETHFHIFGSLAFLAFYRDWKVLIPATVVVALDHLIRGVYFSQSVFGVANASSWRWLEHAGWVLFEAIFLIASCLRGMTEIKQIAERTAELETTNQTIEAKVKTRTHELVKAKENLENEIVERKKLEGLIVQSEKMAAIGQLAGGVAHEINNPLGVILGFAQNIARRIKEGDPLELPIKSIEREAVRCKNLVHDLLTFSRVEKGQKEEIKLNETIDAALSLVLAQGRVKQVSLEKTLQPDLPKILGNSTQIQQIIINLSNNAMDAMPGGGKLMIRTKAVDFEGKPAVRIEVQDTGCGIPQNIHKKVFEPFFTTKEIGKGTGLGLSLVYEIVQKHSGSITFQSSEKQGTLFLVDLPVLSA